MKNSKGKNFTEYIILSKNGALTYMLVIPQDLSDGKELVVESLNLEGTNELDKIEEKNIIITEIISQLKNMIEVVDDAPIVIPFIPDVERGIPYYQQLSRECFEDSKNGEYKIEYPRIDLQVVNTINNAKNEIRKETGKEVADKIFLNGYSSSGVFAQRFALIHPEIVGRVLIGGASGTIPLPEIDYEYPIGIGDFKDLFGTDFNEEEYKKIQFAYYVGELESIPLVKRCDKQGNKVMRPKHDMLFHPRSTDIRRVDDQQTLAERHRNCIDYYETNGYNITSKIYRDMRHTGVFSNINPCFRVLLEDIELFYKEGKKFSKKDGVEEIRMELQSKHELYNER